VQLRPVGRFASIEQVVQRTGLRRDELTTLADIGALNAFTHERRSALWQVERAVRPAGELFRDLGFGIGDSGGSRDSQDSERCEPEMPVESRTPNPQSRQQSPLRPMDDHDRLRADYAGMGLTIGP